MEKAHSVAVSAGDTEVIIATPFFIYALLINKLIREHSNIMFNVNKQMLVVLYCEQF
jgi:hypothetical protein